MWKWTYVCVSGWTANGFPRREGGKAYMLDDLVGGRAVVLEDVVLGGAGGLDELLDDGLQGVSPGCDRSGGFDVPESPGGPRRGYRGSSRRGTWE